MAPRVLDFWSHPIDPALLDMAVRHLREGGLVAMPTETVYGFGSVLDDRPLRELQRLKGRGPDKPFLLLIPGAEAVAELEWSPEARELAKVFWPGALTLVLNDPQGRFPPGVRNAEGGVAIRVSPHPVVQAVLGALAAPMVSTSANRPGGLAAQGAEEARVAAEALGAGDDLWILDGGVLGPSDPSTIVDFSGGEPLIRRAGAVPVHRLRRVLPEIHDPA